MLKKLFIIHFSLFICAAHAADDCATRTTPPTDTLSLPAVIELGLCRNPTTASSYLAYRAAGFNKNAGYANYLPNVSASGSMNRNYRSEEWTDWSYNASLSASYLLFDFGKRLADLNALAAMWSAAGFDYDATVQDYVYSVIGAYYGLLTADADVKSSEQLRTVAKTAKDTADKKFKAGSVAKADVLKADTTLAARDLDLERARNNRRVARGALLTKLSFPADGDIEIADMPSEFGAASENKSIDELLTIAKKQRPDLLRAGADTRAALARRNSALLKNLPSISATGTLSYNENPANVYDYGNSRTAGSIGIRASMPIFAGFANMYGVRAAHANYERAAELERYAADSANLDVFTAYSNYKTAQTVLTQTQTLLKSAAENERVTSGMYKVGRAAMLDWQTAQGELADAEKQHNAAKYDLFVKRAALALAVGQIRSGLGTGD